MEQPRFVDVAMDAVNETRDKFRQVWKDPEPHTDAVNLALGLFIGIVLRRLKGEPDPDAAIEKREKERHS